MARTTDEPFIGESTLTTSSLFSPRVRGQHGVIRRLAASGAGTLNKHGRGHQPKKPRNQKARRS